MVPGPSPDTRSTRGDVGTRMSGPAVELVIGDVIGARPSRGRESETAGPDGHVLLVSDRRPLLHESLPALTHHFFNQASTTRTDQPPHCVNGGPRHRGDTTTAHWGHNGA